MITSQKQTIISHAFYRKKLVQNLKTIIKFLLLIIDIYSMLVQTRKNLCIAPLFDSTHHLFFLHLISTRQMFLRQKSKP